MLNAVKINKTRFFSILLSFCVVFSFVTGCKNDIEKVTIQDEDGGKIEFFRNKKTLNKEGIYVKFDAENRKVESANYKKDTLDGERQMFYPNGNVQVIENYKSGKFDGVYKSYFTNGTIESEGQYANNEMTGKWTFYYDSGAKKEIVHFEKNEENGEFVEYYANGNLKAEGNYKNGDKEHGVLKLYDQQGNLNKKMECNEGVCKTIWESVPN